MSTEQQSLVPPERVLMDSNACNKRALLAEMAELLPSIDPDVALEALLARERLGSTGIGQGVAIPHGRIPDLAAPTIVVARHGQGVNFDAIDDKPVYIVVLLLVPGDEDRTHLELLAHIARILQDEGIRLRMMEASTAEDISGLFPPLILKAA
ncbi:MAG: PTS sugar transporter subunit IIA [Mariprofundaceae bacterium]